MSLPLILSRNSWQGHWPGFMEQRIRGPCFAKKGHACFPFPLGRFLAKRGLPAKAHPGWNHEGLVFPLAPGYGRNKPNWRPVKWSNLDILTRDLGLFHAVICRYQAGSNPLAVRRGATKPASIREIAMGKPFTRLGRDT